MDDHKTLSGEEKIVAGVYTRAEMLEIRRKLAEKWQYKIDTVQFRDLRVKYENEICDAVFAHKKDDVDYTDYDKFCYECEIKHVYFQDPNTVVYATFINPGMWCYFNDADELIFPGYPDEIREKLRKIIMEMATPASRLEDFDEL